MFIVAKDNAFIAEANRRMAMQKARDMRFKKPMLADMNWEGIINGLYDIEEACSDVAYWFVDDKNLVSAFDGDEDEAYEFKMVFADIEGNAVRLRHQLSEVENEMYNTGYDDMEEYFNNCTVALIGNRYDVIGFDSYEEDYLSLTAYEERLATTEAGKKVMRMTKAEMISSIGHCMGILLCWQDLKGQYESIRAALDILRGTNESILKTVREINELYDKAVSFDDWGGEREFEKLTDRIHQEAWLF